MVIKCTLIVTKSLLPWFIDISQLWTNPNFWNSGCSDPNCSLIVALLLLEFKISIINACSQLGREQAWKYAPYLEVNDFYRMMCGLGSHFSLSSRCKTFAPSSIEIVSMVVMSNAFGNNNMRQEDKEWISQGSVAVTKRHFICWFLIRTDLNIHIYSTKTEREG